jgi:hypothetical protein
MIIFIEKFLQFCTRKLTPKELFSIMLLGIGIVFMVLSIVLFAFDLLVLGNLMSLLAICLYIGSERIIKFMIIDTANIYLVLMLILGVIITILNWPLIGMAIQLSAVTNMLFRVESAQYFYNEFVDGFRAGR